MPNLNADYRDKTSPVWDMSQERAFIETLTNQRLNFFLVVFSIVIAGAINSRSQMLFQIVLIVGTIVCIALAATILRANYKLGIILRDIFNDKTHPATIVNQAAGGFSVRWIIGYFIPSLCCLVLATGVVLSVTGTMKVAELNKTNQSVDHTNTEKKESQIDSMRDNIQAIQKYNSISKTLTDTSHPKLSDSLLHDQIVNTVTIQIPGESRTEPKSSHLDGWPGIKELLIAYAWPLVIVFVILLFYRHFSVLLKQLAEYVKNLDKISFGDWEFTTKKGEATFPTPAPAPNAILSDDATPQPANLSKITNKILSTLWKYQKAFDDFSKRWTFTIGAFNPEYAEFITAMRLLASRGLVAQDPQSSQFLLTDIGILYCKKYEVNLTELPYEFK